MQYVTRAQMHEFDWPRGLWKQHTNSLWSEGMQTLRSELRCRGRSGRPSNVASRKFLQTIEQLTRTADRDWGAPHKRSPRWGVPNANGENHRAEMLRPQNNLRGYQDNLTRTRSRCGPQVKPISQLTRQGHRKQSKQQSEQNKFQNKTKYRWLQSERSCFFKWGWVLLAVL